jgi:hypothetical protein
MVSTTEKIEVGIAADLTEVNGFYRKIEQKLVYSRMRDVHISPWLRLSLVTFL